MVDQNVSEPANSDRGVSFESLDSTQPLVIPVIQEQVRIDREVVETGRVSVQKRVHEETRTLDLPTLYQNVDIERLPINRIVEQAPEARYEGDTLVIPVVREEVVTMTRLVLVEEIRLKNTYRTEVDSQPITLRREEVTINREPTNQP